jgi:hypothetical protein
MSLKRAIARRLLEELPRKPWLKGRATIEVVAWDDPLASTPLGSTEPPQCSVNRYNTPPSHCDLTVAILWGRLGTPLALQKADQSAYTSGTEWEILDARRAGRMVWLYRRTQAPSVELDDPHYEVKRQQYLSVKAFFAQLDGTDGVLLGGVNDYENVRVFTERLAQHLEAELRRRLEAVFPEERCRAFRVFLATAADDVRAVRLRLESQLRELPTVELLRELPPPLEQVAHGIAVREAMAHSDLCVHVLGTRPGFPVEWAGSTTETYPMEQLRLGLEHARAQLVLQAPELDHENLSDAPYRELMQHLMGRPEARERLEIVKASRQQMLGAILEKQRALEERGARQLQNSALDKSTAPFASAAFIDVHPKDAQYAVPLIAHLRQCRVTPLTLPAPAAPDLSPARRARAFADHVRKCDRLIIVFGTVERHWVDERLYEASKLILSERLPAKVGVYVAPPSKKEPERRFPGLYTVIDNAAGFDAASLAPFLDRELTP